VMVILSNLVKSLAVSRRPYSRQGNLATKSLDTIPGDLPFRSTHVYSQILLANHSFEIL